MGLTFKENCSDLRNSGISSVIKNLIKNKCVLDYFDPLTTQADIKKIYGKKSIIKLIDKKYDGIIIAVAHEYFKKMGINKIIKLGKKKHVIFDLKPIFYKDYSDLTL